MAGGKGPTGWRGKPEKREAKWGWKPGRKERLSGLRNHWKKIALLLGILGCIGAGVVLLLLLGRPIPARLIIVGADPARIAGRLDVPMDIHGWQGGKMLARALHGDELKLIPKDSTAPLECDAAKLEEQVQEALRQGKDNPYSATIVYFGLLGAADADGAYLFGPDGKRVIVKELIEKLAAVAQQRPLVLVFDAARVALAPEQGLFENKFVEQLKTDLKGKRYDHVAVLCSSSEGELAWNNETLGCSAFLVHLVDALKGGTKAKFSTSFFNYDFPLDDFVRYVREETVKWTEARKITKQTPCVINDDEQNVVHNSKIQLKRVFTGLSEGRWDEWSKRDEGQITKLLTELERGPWKFQDDLAVERPGPEVYTPLQWQRYRALLRRYEAAVCTEHDGDAVQAALATLLEALSRAIKAGRLPHVKGVEESNLVWSELLGTAVPAMTEPPGDVERHLRFKLKEFRDRLKKPLDEESYKLVHDVRNLAERVGLACPTSYRESKAYAYPERFWVAQTGVRKLLNDLDAQRRVAEDQLFTRQHAEGKSALAQVAKQYQTLLETCARQQEALGVYHAALRDLPSLAAWQIYCAELIDPRGDTPEAREQKAVVRANELGKLAEAIRQLGKLIRAAHENGADNRAELEQAAKVVRESVQGQRDKLRRFLDGLNPSDMTPTGWLAYERALTFPWPGGPGEDFTRKKRGKVLQEFRQIQKAVEEGKGTAETAAAWKPERFVAARTTVILGLLTAVDRPLASGAAATAPEAAQLAKRWRELLDDYWSIDIKDRKKEDLEKRLKEFETLSRIAWHQPPPAAAAVGREAVRLQEPAEELRDVQWARLLYGQARRLCRDHWYTLPERPFSYRLARGYVKAAGSLAAERAIAEVYSEDDIDRLENSKDVLKIDGGAATVSWTSELRREFAWKVSGTLPAGEEGRVALLATAQEANAFLTPEAVEPASLLIQPAGEEGRFWFKPLTELSSSLTKTCTVQPLAYFRGRVQGGALTVTNHSRPNLVYTEQDPRGGATFTVSSEKGLGIGVGRLAILIDYSGSMLPARGASETEGRQFRAIKKLEELLDRLPSGVELSIRLFSDETSAKYNGPPRDELDKNPNTAADITRSIQSWSHTTGVLTKEGTTAYFTGKTYEGGAVGQEGSFATYRADRKKKISDIMNNLLGIKPSNLTPLIKSMGECYQKDVIAAGADDSSTVVLVLTDGADTSRGLVSERDDPHVKEKQDDIKAIFNGAKCSVRIILFNEDANSKETLNAKKQLAVLDEIPNSGVTFAASTKELAEQLEAALRPRVVVSTEAVANRRRGQLVKSQSDNDFFYVIHDRDLRPVRATSRLTESGLYRVTTMGSLDRRNQQMQLEPGDHVFVKVDHGPSNAIEYKRGLFAEFWKQSRGGAGGLYAEQGDWRLTAPLVRPFGAGGERSPGLSVTLENARERLKDGVLQMHQPTVWWEVRLSDAQERDVKPVPGTVHVTRKHHYFAPTWEMEFVGAGEGKESVRLRAFQPATPGSPLVVPGNDVVTPRGYRPPDQGDAKNPLRVHVIKEEHLLYENGRPGATRQPCIVVRLENTGGKRYAVKLTGASFERTDHQFHDLAGAQTTLFSGFTDDIGSRSLQLFLTDVEAAGEPVIKALVPMTEAVTGPTLSVPRETKQ